MPLLLNQPSKLCFRKPLLVRASPLISDDLSSSLLHTPPCFILDATSCGANLGKLSVSFHPFKFTRLEKKVPMKLVYNDSYDKDSWLASYLFEEGETNDDKTDGMVTIGSSHGWVATLKDGIVRLQDDLNPIASDSDPKRISLPPLVTLPHCQTQIVTNVAMSSPSPEDEDCVVAVKFLGSQLSFCRPGQPNSEWINIRISTPCFVSSPVMFSKKHDMFRIPGSGGDFIGSWDLSKHKHTPKIQRLIYQNLPERKKSERERLHPCCTREYLVESESTGESFLVKRYMKTSKILDEMPRIETEALEVFKLDEEGNAVYTEDIGDLCIFLSKSEPFCVSARSFPGLTSNNVFIYDVNEFSRVDIKTSSKKAWHRRYWSPYCIPPQKIN